MVNSVFSANFALRCLDIVLILYARAPLLDFWGAVMLVVFARALLDLAKLNLDFVNSSTLFLSLFLQFPSVNFFLNLATR